MSLFLRQCFGTASRASARYFSLSTATRAKDPETLLSNMEDELSKSLFRSIQQAGLTPTPRVNNSSTFIPSSLGGASSISAERLPSIPRVGAYAGRTISVAQPSQLKQCIRRLDALNRTNNVRRVVAEQSRYVRPSKVRYNQKFQRKRRAFTQGIRELFSIVHEVRRKGY